MALENLLEMSTTFFVIALVPEYIDILSVKTALDVIEYSFKSTCPKIS